MPVKVTETDKGLKKMLANIEKQLKSRTLTVGVHEEQGAGEHGGTTIADIATINEFGLGVPERSFVRAFADAKEPDYPADIRKLAQAVLKGQTNATAGLNAIGEKYVGEVQARISAGIAPANAPSTIAKKGSSTPLIDEGVLRSSITKKVT